MIKYFNDLSYQLQSILTERFARYDMDAQYMWNESGIFSDEVKSMSDRDIIVFIDKKDISHEYPKSIYPELSSEPSNVFLEDSAINRARGAEIVSPHEIQIAFQDQISDTFDLDINEDGILDLGPFNTQYEDSYEWFDWENFDFSDYLFL